MNTPASIKLTQTVQKGGCAAKIAAVELRRILGEIDFPPPPNDLLIGSRTFDDAAVWRISNDLALVQTLDFFTPIVDSPKWFGKIAAANALSDVYAMGGEPKTALAILAFPLATLPTPTLVEVLRGALETITSAGAALVGGHTIDDDTLKFGLSVTGYVHPEKIWSNAGAKPGDALLLTKPLGTGTLTAALKRGEVLESDISDALQSMAQLNTVPRLLSPDLAKHIHAATDVTGFGLAGHALNMARASGVSLHFECASLPRFLNVLKFLECGFLTKAHRTNAEYVQPHAVWDCQNIQWQQLVFDPQTSGGLLLSVSEGAADQVLANLKPHFPACVRIGRVDSKGCPGSLRFS